MGSVALVAVVSIYKRYPDIRTTNNARSRISDNPMKSIYSLGYFLKKRTISESRDLNVRVCCVNVGPQARARARARSRVRVERPGVIRFTATNHSNYFRPGQLQLTGRETSIMHQSARPRIADDVTNRVTLRFARLVRSVRKKKSLISERSCCRSSRRIEISARRISDEQT